ncbi:GtrA family protein [Aeromicrobium sp.]|nr:GtrA family protein [Candidatus Saccharibacteria bacterium]
MFGLFSALILRGDKSYWEAAAQAAKYMVGGGVYFWSAYAIFALCYSGLHWYWLPAKMLGDVVGWALNYFIQRYWAFAGQAHLSEMNHAGRYIAIEAVGFVLDYAIIGGLRAVGVSPYGGFFISAAFFSIWSYLWYKYWVFPENKEMIKAEQVEAA